jgi:large repetitive protein
MFYQIKFSILKAQAIIACGVIGVWHSAQGQMANNNFYITLKQTALTISAPGILANDTGGNLTAKLVAGPVNGTLSLSTNGSFTYTPTNGFTGVDGFTYQAVSGSQTSAVASVDVMVLAPGGELFYDNFSRPASSGSVFPWTTVSNTSGAYPVLGTWGITNNLLIGYSPFNSYGYIYFNTNWTDYSVQAQIRFAANNASSAAIFGRLNAASGAQYSVWIYPEESPEYLASGNGTAIMRFIKCQTWNTSYTVVGNPAILPVVGVNWHTVKLTFKGTNIAAYFDGVQALSVKDNGSLDGKPAFTSGGVGLAMWTLPPAAYAYSVANLLVITTNAVANYDTYNAITNTTLQVAAPGILANDAGHGPLTATRVFGPYYGSLTLTNNGGFRYTPTNGFTGMDNFQYQCTDGQSTAQVERVTIKVNNWAFANNDTYGMSSDKTLNVGPPGILATAQDGTGPLTAILDNGPADGSLTLNSNGGFSYVPTNGFTGMDSFTYQCTDGESTSQVATATINVVTSEPAPAILSLNLTNNVVAITWSSAANLIYQLQSNTSLNPTNWINVSPNTTATGPTTSQTNPVGDASQQFYRIILLTP